MSIFKKTKAYEVENVVVTEKGKTTGVATDMFICEKTSDKSRKMMLPDNTVKIYINN